MSVIAIVLMEHALVNVDAFILIANVIIISKVVACNALTCVVTMTIDTKFRFVIAVMNTFATFVEILTYFTIASISIDAFALEGAIGIVTIGVSSAIVRASLTFVIINTNVA